METEGLALCKLGRFSLNVIKNEARYAPEDSHITLDRADSCLR